MRPLFLWMLFLFIAINFSCCTNIEKDFDAALTPLSDEEAFFNNKVAIIPGLLTYHTNAVIYLPANFSTAQKYPLVIYCHSMGEAGTDIAKLYTTGLPKVLQEGYKPFFDFIMIAPQRASYSIDPKWLPAIVEDAKKRLPIDESRIYLTGVSAGGWAAYGSQLNLDTSVGKLFAAIVVCSGATQNANKNNIKQWRITQTPLWAIVGENDPAYLNQNQYMVEKINEQVEGLATLTILPGVGHEGWEEVYRGTVKKDSLDIWQWLYQFKRD